MTQNFNSAKFPGPKNRIMQGPGVYNDKNLSRKWANIRWPMPMAKE